MVASTSGPISLDDDSISRLAKALNLNRGGGTLPPPPSGSGAGNAAVSSAAAEALGTVGKFGSRITNEVEGSVNAWKQASQIGIGFNNDALGLRASIAGTRLSTDEWSDSINKGKLGMTSLAGTMTDSAKRFNQLSQEFSNTDAADQLRKMGFTTKEYNDILAISTAGKKFADFQDAESRKKANMAAADLALEMDKVAQLTGISRREQQEALQEKQKNARVQATIEMQIRQGGKEAQDSYNKMTSSMQKLGPATTKLADELYTGQALSQKSIAQLAALGPAGQQLREAINNVREAKTAEQRQAAQLQLERAQAAVAEHAQSDQSLNQIRYGQGEVAESLGEIAISSRNYASGIDAIKKEAAAKGQAMTTEEARLELEKRTNLNRNIATGKAEADARAELAKATTPEQKAAAEKKLAEATASKTTETFVLTVARINDTIATFGLALDAVNKRVTRPGSATETGINKALTGLKNVKTDERTGETTNALDRGGIINSSAVGRAKEALERGDYVEMGKQFGFAAVDVFKNLKEVVTGTLNVAGGIISKPSGPVANPGPNSTSRPGYEGGTAPDMDFSKLVKDFGKKTTVDLHNREAVLTENQLKDMFGSMHEQMMKTTGGAISKVQMPKFDKPLEVPKAPEVKSKTSDIPKPEIPKDFGADIFKQFSMPQSVASPLPQLDINKTLETITAKAEPAPKPADEKVSNMQKDLASRTSMQTEGIFGSLKSFISKFNPANIKPVEAARATDLSRTMPSEVAQGKVESNKKNVPAPAPIPDPVAPTAAARSTLDDIKDQLEKLNTTMSGDVVERLTDMVSNVERQVKATRRLDPDVSLRT